MSSRRPTVDNLLKSGRDQESRLKRELCRLPEASSSSIGRRHGGTLTAERGGDAATVSGHERADLADSTCQRNHAPALHIKANSHCHARHDNTACRVVVYNALSIYTIAPYI